MAKAFISFLGTNDYVDCRYIFDGKKSSVVKYVQEDMTQRFCLNWSETDEIRIFTTLDAKKKNWENSGHKDREIGEQKENTGLGQRLDILGLKPVIKQVDIPIGNSEKEIWEIFNIVYNTMGEDEEIIFDITHSFRSIPMLFMVLAGYAGIMKNIDVTGIYYGAFDTLGHPVQVAKKIPDPGMRLAPIFDLSSFMQLNEWSRATQSFIRHGNADEFVKLVKKKTGPILYKSQGRDRTARDMSRFANNMIQISRNIQYNRGDRIIQHDYDITIKNLEKIKKDSSFIPPFRPLLEKIEQKIKRFEKYDVRNGFKAVEWCMGHDLIQQAVTMLWENIITWVLEEEGIDWSVRTNREDASSAIHFISRNREKNDSSNSQLAGKLKNNKVLMEISSPLEALRNLRNDLNHGGFVRDQNNMAKSPESIRKQFDSIYKIMKTKLF